MDLDRRQFLAFVGASGGFASAGPSLTGRDANAQFTDSGVLASLKYSGSELVSPKYGNARIRLIYERKSHFCDQPRAARREGATLLFEYALPFATVRSHFELLELPDGMAVLKQHVRVEFETPTPGPFTLEIPIPTQLPAGRRNVFLPMKNGIGRRKPVSDLENDDEYVFRFAGGVRGWRPQQLAVPMVDEWAEGSNLHITYAADPYFSSGFRLPYGEKAGRFHCIYGGGKSLGAKTAERTLYTVLHRGPFARAMDAFYASALSDIAAAPEWTHQVAMVDYDYLSKNGRGWFADIDTLTELIPVRDRGKVFLALHGWYDFCGRYAFDYRNKRFDKSWVAMSKARDPYVQSFGVTEWEDAYRWPKASVEAMQPVPMSLEDMHRRIQYARKRGFRVGIYFADGTNLSEGVKDLHDPSKVLKWGGWQGPDTSGRAYAQNPLHPEVYGFFTSYIRALLEEYGKEVDGFIWDETYTVRPDALGPEAAPGYAGVAMMKLVRDCAAAVAAYSRELAFFASDNLGFNNDVTMAPYCLVSHGTYQDSQFHPEAWPYGLLPNYRNVLWSCNWAPVNHARLARYAVETFDVPVAISNGAFGDDIGISDMTATQRREIMELFNLRKSRPMRIGWIEEEAGGFRYQGKALRYRYSL